MDAIDSASLRVQFLIEKLRTPCAKARVESLRELGEIGHPATPAIPFMLQALSDDRSAGAQEDTSVAEVASDALAKLGRPAVLACLAAYAGHPADGYAKMLALTLARFHDPESINWLIASLSDPNPERRQTAIWALEYSTDARLVPAFIHAFQDPDYYVRRAAVVHFRTHRDGRVVQPLINALADQYEGLRCEAARSLGAQRDPRAVSSLVKVARDSGEAAAVRSEAAEAVGAIGGVGVFEALTRLLENGQEHEWVRAGAARGLGQLSDVRASDPLRRALSNDSESTTVRIAAARGLLRLEGTTNVSAIDKVVTSSREAPLLRFWIAVDLVQATAGAVGDVRVVEALRCYRYETYPIACDSARTAATEAFEKVSEGGATRRVRSAARRELLELRGRGWQPKAVWAACVVYYVAGLSAWAFFFRKQLKRLQLTLRAVLSLITITGIGFALAAKAMYP